MSFVRMFSVVADRVARGAGHPVTFAVAAALIVAWAAVGPWFHWSDSHSLWINTATTIVTFLMVFLLQHSQNRDGLAIQTKLDLLLKASSSIDNALLGLDERPEADIKRVREREIGAVRDPPP